MATKGFEKAVENLFDGLFSRAFKSNVKPLGLEGNYNKPSMVKAIARRS